MKIIPPKITPKIICFILMSLFLTSLLITSTGCALKDRLSLRPSLPDSSRPVVYTSIYPLYDFTKKIAGENVTVINITPAGIEPHSFEPSTKLLAELTKASLFIYNGAGMEPYLEKLQKAMQKSPLLMVEASRGITLIKHDHQESTVSMETSSETELEASFTHHDENEAVHEHEGVDPHTWLSPACARQIGQNILQALVQIDPEQQATYEKNFRVLQAQLTELDLQYKETLTSCQRKDLVVTHEAFGYLCREYGLNQISVMGLHAEAEPTPGTLKEIIKLVNNKEIKYIFFEALYSPKVAETISRETNTKILVLNPLGSLTEKALEDGRDYFSIMKENLENLKQALEYQP